MNQKEEVKNKYSEGDLCPICQGAKLRYNFENLICPECDSVIVNETERGQVIFKYGLRIVEPTEKTDMVNHPPHYQSNTGLEVIDVIEAFCADLKGCEATDTANIIKYACRWKKKNGIEDLKKIVWYTNHLIKYLDKEDRKDGNEK